MVHTWCGFPLNKLRDWLARAVHSSTSHRLPQQRDTTSLFVVVSGLKNPTGSLGERKSQSLIDGMDQLGKRKQGWTEMPMKATHCRLRWQQYCWDVGTILLQLVGATNTPERSERFYYRMTCFLLQLAPPA